MSCLCLSFGGKKVEQEPVIVISTIGRLIVAPLIAFILIFLLNLEGTIAKAVFLSLVLSQHLEIALN